MYYLTTGDPNVIVLNTSTTYTCYHHSGNFNSYKNGNNTNGKTDNGRRELQNFKYQRFCPFNPSYGSYR